MCPTSSQLVLPRGMAPRAQAAWTALDAAYTALTTGMTGHTSANPGPAGSQAALSVIFDRAVKDIQYPDIAASDVQMLFEAAHLYEVGLENLAFVTAAVHTVANDLGASSG